MSRHTSYRRAGVALVAAATLSMTAACGSSTSAPGGSAGTATKGSAATTTTSRSTTTASTPTPAGSNVGRDIFAATYAAALKYKSAHMTMTMGSLMTSQGDVTYSAGDPAMSLAIRTPQSPTPMQLRLVDHVLYVQVPGATSGGKYFAIDTRDTSSPMGKAFGSTLSQMNPLSGLRAAESAVTAVKQVGHEQVQGVDTERYLVTMDTAKALGALKAQIPQAALSSVPRTLVYQVWLDQQQRLRQLEYAVGSTRISMQLSSWGEPVQVSKPPASAIVKQPGS